MIIPNSWGAALTEFNPCHSPKGDKGGQFCATGGHTTPAGPGGRVVGRPTPIRVNTVEEAIPLILAGKVVELRETRQVNTLLSKLAVMAQDAAAKGEKAPHYDLCNVTVKGTNLFCHDQLRTKQFPNGVPRIEMPQFAGEPVPGSPAEKLPRKTSGSVDGAPAFIEHLKSLGIRTTSAKAAAASLKASQSELVGPKVAAMMTSRAFDPHDSPIFISRDNYVVDGHHRWAAIVGLDARDGKLGGLRMNVVRVDAPITEVLQIANKWSKSFGIYSKSARAGVGA